MDLLATLNLEDLPEQQTRTVHLIESHPDFDLRLGFDSCCCCGKPSPMIDCNGCYRVKYCSKECQQQDANPPLDDENETALGHSTIICALLKLCNDDEAVEVKNDDNNDNNNKMKKNNKNNNIHGGGGGATTVAATAAALDRVISEYESYPATLANIILDGPCYQNVLYSKKGSSISIHVIGASLEAELWGDYPTTTSNNNNKHEERNVVQAYAEALGDLADTMKFKQINIHFVGPECPKETIKETVPIPSIMMTKSSSSFSTMLQITTHCQDYNTTLLLNNNESPPDIVIFFNPGFTCPDYDWVSTLQSIPKGTPFLVTTNTEVEGLADTQYLLDHDLLQSMPPAMAELLELGDAAAQDETASDSFFAINPVAGNRVRQSGTMANDLFVKNRWMLGGIFGTPSKPDKPGSKKKIKIDGSGNTKSSNPALV